MEVHHSYQVELSLGNHPVAVLGLAVGLVAAGLAEHMSVKYRMNADVGHCKKNLYILCMKQGTYKGHNENSCSYINTV